MIHDLAFNIFNIIKAQKNKPFGLFLQIYDFKSKKRERLLVIFCQNS
jgi:hypothetical protein